MVLNNTYNTKTLLIWLKVQGLAQELNHGGLAVLGFNYTIF